MATNPHIYVSSVYGTNTGTSDESYASQQTGAMSSISGGASSVYDNIGSAIAGASPSSGDTIYVADDHAAAYDNGGNVTIGSGVYLISVDASNIENYKPGATEHLTDTAYDYVVSNVFMAGLDLETGDDVIVCSTVESVIRLIDVTLRPDSSFDRAIFCNQDGIFIDLVNVDIVANGTGAYGFSVSNNAKIRWRGGSVSTLTSLFLTFGENGGLTLDFNGVDLSSATSIAANVSSSSIDNINYKLINCRLNSGVTIPSGWGKAGQRFEMYNTDDSTSDVFHRFYITDHAGAASNNDSVYVTATEAWSYDGSTKSSIEVTTTANCSHYKPFVFELPAQYIDLSQAASDVLTLDLVTDSTALSLTDTDIAAFLVYPDGTTAVQANWVTSGKTVGTGNYGIDPLAAGTALSASSLGAGDWTGEPASANFYKMELDTSGDAGAATVCSIRIEVYKASIASGDLFIHPLITTS